MGTRLTIQPSTLKRRLSLFKACCFLTTRLGFFRIEIFCICHRKGRFQPVNVSDVKARGGRPPYQAAFIV